jgi:hypothetical protein
MKPMTDFTFQVAWSNEDQKFVATSPQWTYLSWLDKDPLEALRGLIMVIDEWQKDEEGK